MKEASLSPQTLFWGAQITTTTKSHFKLFIIIVIITVLIIALGALGVEFETMKEGCLFHTLAQQGP